MTRKQWLLTIPVAVTLLVAGALLAGPVAGVAQDQISGIDAKISRQEAEDIAIGEYPDAEVREIELDKEAGVPVYEIDLSNGVDLDIHGDTGEILMAETDDDSDDDAEERIVTENPPALSREEAVAIAEGEHPGATAHEVELDVEAGIVVYSVELSNGVELEIDANSGEVLQAEQDDDVHELDHDDDDDDDDFGDDD